MWTGVKIRHMGRLLEQKSVLLLPPPLLLLFLTCEEMSLDIYKECRRALELHDSALATKVCSLVGLSVLQTHTCYVFETDGAVRKIHKPISS